MVESQTFAASFSAASRMMEELKARIGANIFGQQELITEALVTFVAGGHILITGAPGLAKTTLVRVFSQQLSLQFGRIQFTPDLLPGDITGSDVLNIDTESGRRSFEFIPGPVFANLLLADEINRASPRTQSALLEAMQERSVTVGGRMHRLTLPFMVFATQNPYESEGTFPLPEAQLDRFLLHALVDYPDAAAESHMLTVHADGQLFGEKPSGSAVTAQATNDDGRSAPRTLATGEVIGLIETAKRVAIAPDLIDAIRDLVRSTRPHDELCPVGLRAGIWYGAGPRAGIGLISAAKALALIEGSETVRWRHVRRLAKPVLRHRLRLTAVAMRDGFTEDSMIEQILNEMETKYAHLARGVS